MTRTNDRTKLFVILGMGANLADPVGQMRRAVEMLSGCMTVGNVSSVYVTEPVGFADQPDFHNLVLSGWTTESVYGLHEETRKIEKRLGRTGTVLNGPRVIDIDILAYGELVLTSPGLTVPHPRMMERAFVLEPLAEICPEWRHPLSGVVPDAGLAMLGGRERVERQGRLPGREEEGGGC